MVLLQARCRFYGILDLIEELACRAAALGKEVYPHGPVKRRLVGVVYEDAALLALCFKKARAVDLPTRRRQVLFFLKDQQGVAYLDRCLILQTALIDLLAIEEGPIGRAKVLDQPVAGGWHDVGMFARTPVVIEADLGILSSSKDSRIFAGKDSIGFSLILSFSYA